ncbi:ADP-ribosylation factor-like protein Arf6 [Carpediemonas membranifera]|uniref:ADP-ribosylation factor-like protein Arf6 n=1 Tax=Carpediemonas membranifera TaxID=201153 RepID=A0A8J6E1Z7_9EUKA|nr:ADP-ribosylation factor-like protein Arf6 [Carpediemonas membranifera]|eukprot:KAG9394073.1 ADP-ribosylation factor-like protein Arf6 [Carpediemonas membranifera]
MGGIISKGARTAFGPLFKSKKRFQILFVGLESAGKSTIFKWITDRQFVATNPTVGFDMAKHSVKNIDFMMWDLGGQYAIRPQWRHYYTGTFLIVFVVDTANEMAVRDAGAELHNMLRESSLKGVNLLILFNKRDLPNALPEDQVMKLMRLESIRDNQYRCQLTCGLNGEGVEEALTWLVAVAKQGM